MKSALKWVLVVLAVVIVIVIAYTVIASRSNTNPSSSLGSSLVSGSNSPLNASAEATQVAEFSNDLLVLLTSIENITLDASVFSNPGFDALSDISISLRREGNQGRPNPFAVIGELGVGGPNSIDDTDNEFSDDIDVVTEDSERTQLAEDLIDSFGLNPGS